MTPAFRKGHAGDEEESYYVSMTDLLVGVIFIFVIILMYYALRFQEAEETRLSRIEELETARLAREEILRDVKRSLEAAGVVVEIDVANGTLHLPEDVLFESGQAGLNERGRDAVRALGFALTQVLPCYTPARSTACVDAGKRADAQVESVLIEGHTDNRPVSPGNPIGDNWRLSAARAISTFQELRTAAPQLDELRNERGQRLFSVSGYSEYRPRRENDTEEGRRANRRIDLRVLMRAPIPEDLRQLDEEVNSVAARDVP